MFNDLKDQKNDMSKITNDYNKSNNLIKINKDKWISVKDRLPDKKGYYLVAIPDTYRKPIEWSIFTLYFRGKTKWATCNGHIKYWMSLPEPPISK